MLSLLCLIEDPFPRSPESEEALLEARKVTDSSFYGWVEEKIPNIQANLILLYVISFKKTSVSIWYLENSSSIFKVIPEQEKKIKTHHLYSQVKISQIENQKVAS